MIVLGLDPGFASFGWAIVNITSESTIVSGLGVIRTQKNDAKKKILACEDSFSRAREIASEITHLLHRRPSVICMEAMSWPRNASTAAKIALAYGVVASMAQERKIPVLQASPQQVKKKVCGRKDASKDDVKASLVAKLGDQVLTRIEIDRKSHGFPRGQDEHALDALASVVACSDDDIILGMLISDAYAAAAGM